VRSYFLITLDDNKRDYVNKSERLEDIRKWERRKKWDIGLCLVQGVGV